MSLALPTEAGRPRVQRLVDALHPVHLEAEIPNQQSWALEVGGLVARPLRLARPELAELGAVERSIDVHCVWGWTRRGCRWLGVLGATLLERCGPLPAAAWAVVQAIDSPYASCVPLADLADGIFAWGLDGGPLAPGHGGPLRFVAPSRLWGYKGVKWVGRVTLVENLEPGFWETKVGDVEGRVPRAILNLFEGESQC